MSKESLEQTISALKHEVERLSAAREIENLKNRYFWLMGRNRFEECLEFFALKTPGLRLELCDSGVYEGAESVTKLYRELHPKFFTMSSPGAMGTFYATSPIIEVAEDGETAKGLWNILGQFAAPTTPGGKPEAWWHSEKHALDFVKEDGRWKIWHYRVYYFFSCTFYKSWTDMKEAVFDGFSPIKLGLIPDELLPDKPTTYHKPYSPEYVIEDVPKIPVPYKTWKETFSY